MRIAPWYAPAAVQLAALLRGRAEGKEAAKVCRHYLRGAKAAGIDPALPVRVHLVQALVEAGERVEAARAVDAFPPIAGQVHDPALWTLLARSLVGMDRRPLAREALDEVLAENPAYGPALQLRKQLSNSKR